MNPIMIDGTGMCGGCRLTVGGKVNVSHVWTALISTDDEVDFDEAMKQSLNVQRF